MPNYIEKVEQLTLPVIILRGSVAFPSIALSFEVTDSASDAAAQAAGGRVPKRPRGAEDLRILSAPCRSCERSDKRMTSLSESTHRGI